MSLALTLACLWAVTASIIAMTPSRDRHWRNAYILIAVGVPILGYVVLMHGQWAGLLVLAGGCSILRWPVIHLIRRMRGWRRPGRAE